MRPDDLPDMKRYLLTTQLATLSEVVETLRASCIKPGTFSIGAYCNSLHISVVDNQTADSVASCFIPAESPDTFPYGPGENCGHVTISYTDFKKFKGSELTFEFFKAHATDHEGHCNVSDGHIKAELQWCSVKAPYPVFFPFSDAKGVPLVVTYEVAEAVASMLKSAVSSDQHRPVLNYGLISRNIGAATDTHRLHIIETETKYLVPIAAFKLAVALGSPTFFTCLSNGKHYMARFESRAGQYLVTWEASANAVFPAYERVIPNTNSFWKAPLGELRDAVRSAMNVAKENANRIFLTFMPDRLQIEVAAFDNASLSEYRSFVPVVDHQLRNENNEDQDAEPGEQFGLALNGRFLLDAVESLGGETLKFHSPGRFMQTRPIFLTSEASGRSSVIMPMASEGYRDPVPEFQSPEFKIWARAKSAQSSLIMLVESGDFHLVLCDDVSVVSKVKVPDIPLDPETKQDGEGESYPCISIPTGAIEKVLAALTEKGLKAAVIRAEDWPSQ